MTRSIWNLDILTSREFADLYPSYTEELNPKNCASCDAVLSSDPRPQVVTWEHPGRPIADFIFCYGHDVVQRRIASEFLRVEPAFDLEELDFGDDPDRDADLVILNPTHLVDPLPQSTLVIDEQCEACGAIDYDELVGVEDEDEPREPGKGFFVAAQDVSGHLFFRPRHTGLLLCTDEGRRWVENQTYSNVQFLEYGELVE